ncbi:hypothetical protein AAHA92_18420 [Salvia divinorum]|uniref:Uncharacterized protein n=1 Tax=Salvia divinorum TaxID=28513 RepID=A0ABD1H217_SALDI
MKKAGSLFLLLVSFFALLTGGVKNVGAAAALPLPYCRVDRDCFPICSKCGFCACIGGICVRGCPAPPAFAIAGHVH